MEFPYTWCKWIIHLPENKVGPWWSISYTLNDEYIMVFLECNWICKWAWMCIRFLLLNTNIYLQIQLWQFSCRFYLMGENGFSLDMYWWGNIKATQLLSWMANHVHKQVVGRGKDFKSTGTLINTLHLCSTNMDLNGWQSRTNIYGSIPSRWVACLKSAWQKHASFAEVTMDSQWSWHGQ